MERVVLILFAAVATTAGVRHTTCVRDYDNIGCFREYKPGKGDLMIYDRFNIDWKNYSSYLHSLACRCDKATRKRNKKREGKYLYVGFALHYYGECYGRTAEHMDKLKGKNHQAHLCNGGQDYTCIDGPGQECAGVEHAEYIYQFKIKAPQNVDGGYTEWEKWTKCQSKCGPGLRLRERTCTNPEPKGNGKDCTGLGENTQSEQCTSKPCPVDGNWSNWSDFSNCSVACGGGEQIRHRFCNNPSPGNDGMPCDGPSTESQRCNTGHCPIHGKWSRWSEYDECTANCGRGTQKRTRGCTNPSPQFGGDDCRGSAIESRDCHKIPCPVDGGYTGWSGYGKCSRTCGGGRQYRSRTCTNPRPANSGKSCRHLGPTIESRPCNQQACPIKEYTKHCCEGKSLTLHCSGDDRLSIRYATYGRKTRAICKHWLSWAMKNNCRAGNSTTKVRHLCEGRRSCTVRAKNSVFGDPCWGTKKYLQVTYRCQ